MKVNSAHLHNSGLELKVNSVRLNQCASSNCTVDRLASARLSGYAAKKLLYTFASRKSHRIGRLPGAV